MGFSIFVLWFSIERLGNPKVKHTPVKFLRTHDVWNHLE